MLAAAASPSFFLKVQKLFLSLTLSPLIKKTNATKLGSLLASAYVYIRPLIRRGIGSATG